MDNEIIIEHDSAGKTLDMYLELNGQMWNGEALEDYNEANWATYATQLTAAGSYRHSGSMTGLAAGNWRVTVRERAGGSAAITDPKVDFQEIAWDGTARVTLNTVTTKLDRILGLSLENAVEDDFVFDTNGMPVSSGIYCYDSAANATTHDKATGLVAHYHVTASHTNRLPTLMKVIKQ